MRKVVVYEFVSLDGIAESPGRFFADAWDDDIDANIPLVIDPQDAVILGRSTYDEWSAFWPTSDIEPFASFINPVAKHVATSTPLAVEWENSSRIDGELLDFVRELKSRAGGDIGVHGSISVARALISAGLVDELRLVIAPIIAGEGRRLFEPEHSMSLELIRSISTPSGYVIADYRAKV